MTKKNAPKPEEPLNSIHALIALAARDGLGEQLDWGDVLPILLNIVRDPVGPRNCRKLFSQVNDPSVMSTIEDWFNRAAAERDGSAKETERAATMITQPVQRGAVGVACGVGLAMAVGTMSGGSGLLLLVAAGGVACGGTFLGLNQRTSADAQVAIARAFQRLEAIAKEARDERKG